MPLPQFRALLITYPRVRLAGARAWQHPLDRCWPSTRHGYAPCRRFSSSRCVHAALCACCGEHLTHPHTQGFAAEDVPFFLTRNPNMLSTAPERRLLRNLQWLEGKGALIRLRVWISTHHHIPGIPLEQVRAAVRRFPGLLMYNTDTLEQKYTTLTDYLGAGAWFV